MDLTILAMSIRMMERSLIVIGGITSIYLGYKLFVLGIGNAQGEASAFGIKLKNFGPGLFFAALGAVVLITTMRASIRVGPADSINNQVAVSSGAIQQTKPVKKSDPIFFGLEDTTRNSNKWTNTAFFLDTRQLLQRLENGEPVEKLADLRNALNTKLESITMSKEEYKRYQELTSKIPLNEAEQKELIYLEEKLFPYNNTKE